MVSLATLTLSGRSAVIIVAYVAYIKKCSIREAFDFVKSKRKEIANLPGLGGIRVQWKSLQRWHSARSNDQKKN